jgi:ketosteroid isomerase-like protein
MSQENVEVVREIYERGALDRNPKALMALAAPEIELVNPADAVEAGTRRGIDSVLASLEDMIASFEWTQHEPLKIHDAGDRVVAWVRFRGKGAASGAELEHHEAHTWTFCEGEIVCMEWGRDLTAALEAVGLRE